MVRISFSGDTFWPGLCILTHPESLASFDLSQLKLGLVDVVCVCECVCRLVVLVADPPGSANLSLLISRVQAPHFQLDSSDRVLLVAR